MRWLPRVAAITLTVLYPFVVYFGLQTVDARYLVLLILLVASLRILGTGNIAGSRLWWLVIFTVLVLWTWLANSPLGLKLYPVVVNLNLLLLFLWSLKHPPSMIEKFARLQDPDLSERGVDYTYRVTQVWCGFFCFNIFMSTLTTFWGSDKQWALYNGFIAYILMGLLFSGEWLVRRRVMANDIN